MLLSCAGNALGDRGALPGDMHPLLALLGSTPVLDEDTADRLLRGRLDPADAPSAYAPVARLVKAARGPATPEELAGEGAAIAAFTAVVHADPSTLVPRRATMPSKLISVKAAAAVLAAVLSVGGVAAAATGLLPDRAAQQATDHASSAAGGGSPAQAQGNGGQGTANGPDATGAAKDGLCQAWQSGQGSTNGKRMDSTAFQALATAAGGADKVAAYCQTSTTASHGNAANGPDATGAAKDGLCRAWEAAQSGQGATNGKRMDTAAFQVLAKAAGGAGNIAAYCQTTTTAAGSHGQGQQQSSGSANGHAGDNGQGGPPTTTG